MLRAYASGRNHVEDALLALQKTTTKIRIGFGSKENELIRDAQSTKRTKVNLSRALKTLVHVHGIQFMVSGVYNADPVSISIHPNGLLLDTIW